ncbi:unnamed protein product [Polarella glacialis]|uniref:Reverse transcriptase domain-containing protein n=1 Tax=Polarella glacialis TaxID=89957 RepID=A0A813DRF9_POLGL|nr:unnamed protein product [Polarella glacialis]
MSNLLVRRWELRAELAELVADGQVNSAAADSLKRRLRTLVKRLSQERTRSWQQRQHSLALTLAEASATGNWRQAWIAARQLSQASWGPRGRVYHHVSAEAPSAQEWGEALKRQGPDGGCSAEVIWESELEDIGEFFRLNQTALLAPNPRIKQLQNGLEKYTITEEQAADLGSQDLEHLTAALAKRNNGFATPPWALPKDVWRLLLNGTWAPELPKLEGSTSLRRMMQQLLILIRRTGQVPLLWATSLGFPVPKHNLKTGTKAYRLLHLIDPVSKSWVSGIWRQKQFSLSSTAFGYVPHRTREEASIIARVLSYRLCQSKHSVVWLMFDVSNAFPSMSWSWLDRSPLVKFSESDRHFLSQRRRQANCVVWDGSQNVIVCRAGSGNRQGDSPAAQQFALAFDRLVQLWAKRTSAPDRNLLVARSTWTHDPVFLGSIVFADDVLRLVPVSDFSTAAATCSEMAASFRKYLRAAGMDMSLPKLQVLCCWAGKDACDNRQKQLTISTGDPSNPVSSKHTAKHLGFTLSDLAMQGDLGSKVEIASRIAAANKAWRTMWHLWTARDIDLKLKIHIYRAVVLSALLSGLHTLVISRNQLHYLEAWHSNKLRLFLQGEAAGWSNTEVRRACNCPAVCCLIRRARVKFWQGIVSEPSHHVALCAAISGKISSLCPQLSGKIPHEKANPWLKLVWQDLQIVASIDSNFEHELEEYGWKGLPNCHHFSTFQPSKLLNFDCHCTGVLHEHLSEVRCACGVLCRGNCGLAMRRFRKRGEQPVIFKWIATNQCPRCLGSFSSKRNARLHLFRCFSSHCATRIPTQFSVRAPRYLICPTCPDIRFSTLATLQHHFQQHLQHLAETLHEAVDSDSTESSDTTAPSEGEGSGEESSSSGE